MGNFATYVWGAYLAAPALMFVEIAVLLLRKRQILGHLGWRDDELKRD